MDPYSIKAGQTFDYAGDRYTATADATGEFNTYVRCTNHRTGTEGEIVIRHGNTVTPVEKTAEWPDPSPL